MSRPIDPEIQQFLDLYYISWFRINQTYHLWAQQHGLTDSTLFLLDEIHRTPEGCTLTYLVGKVFLPKQTVSSILQKLEEQGLILRKIHPKDQRNRIITLTKTGQTYVDDLMQQMEQAETNAYLLLSKEEQQAIRQGFSAFASAIEQSFLPSFALHKKH